MGGSLASSSSWVSSGKSPDAPALSTPCCPGYPEAPEVAELPRRQQLTYAMRRSAPLPGTAKTAGQEVDFAVLLGQVPQPVWRRLKHGLSPVGA